MNHRLIGIVVAVIMSLFVAGARLVYGGEPAPAPVETTVNLNSCAKCVWSVKFQQFRCKWCWLKPASPDSAFVQ